MTEKRTYELSTAMDAFGEHDPELLESIPTDRIKADSDLYREGNRAIEFSVVRRGRLQGIRYGRSREKSILGVFGPGEPIGAESVINGTSYDATYRALEDTVVYRFSSVLLEDLQTRAPRWFTHCVAQVGFRYEDLADRLQSFTSENLDGRLSCQLCKLAEKHGDDVEDGVAIDMELRRETLADMVGCSVESTIRHLSRWEKEGIIRTEKSHITILKPEFIRSVASKHCEECLFHNFSPS